MKSGCYQTCDVCHIYHKNCANLICNLTETLEIDCSRICRCTGYDELRLVERASKSDLDEKLVAHYLEIAKANKPNFSTFSDDRIADLMGVFVNDHPTLCSLLVFSPYPQVYFPQLCVTAVRIAGTEIGDLADDGQRFIDNKRIEGNLQQVLEGTLRFVRTNMKVGTKIDATTGMHLDQPEYPMIAVREAVLNACRYLGRNGCLAEHSESAIDNLIFIALAFAAGELDWVKDLGREEE